MVTAAADEAFALISAKGKMVLEKCLEFIEDDELVEITPKNIRMRKSLLSVRADKIQGKIILSNTKL